MIVSFGLRAQKKKVQSGQATLLGQSGIVTSAIKKDKPGQVSVLGEIWRANAETNIPKDAKVRIQKVENLTITVEKEE